MRFFRTRIYGWTRNKALSVVASLLVRYFLKTATEENLQLSTESAADSYLQVVLWVPVRVEDDAGVCCCEVDSQPTGSRTQKENKAV